MNNRFQDDVAKTMLSVIDRHGFVLSGGKALVEHGISHRPTLDIDLFTSQLDPAYFEQSINDAQAALTDAGYCVSVVLKTTTFARLRVSSNNDVVDVELGYDYREYEPTISNIGPILNKKDAILNKVSALYARALPRDYIDVYNARRAKILSDNELISLSKERDSGFVPYLFADSLRHIQSIPFEEFSSYGITRKDFDEIVKDTLMWADNIQHSC
ncbi:MAG: nucleotidyl transferase AbiEii/AbiGii toxin family protein [Coriobacteriales bacterium]|jgi:hypothetical protein|nr:nucleotidyl transferase AbiEii/AbiGii toxin family protein [Coriobacteriales bacterium]